MQAPRTNLSSLEQAGDFTIEQNSPTVDSSGENRSGEGAGVEEANPVTPRDKNKILEGLENPEPGRERLVPKGAIAEEETKREPLVEQLMHSSTAIPHEKVSREPDQYREPLI